jgi:hypothetical protein
MSGPLIRQETAVTVATRGPRSGGGGFTPKPVRARGLLLMASPSLSPNTNGTHLSLCNVAYIIVLLVMGFMRRKGGPLAEQRDPSKIPSSAVMTAHAISVRAVQNGRD